MIDLQGLNVYLIGMMGTGKSTLGPLLAERLGYNFIDTDKTIEQVTNLTVTEIFTADGETGFREIESQVLREVAAYTRLVIGTGGGIVTQQQNWSHLQHGLTIWLNVPVAAIAARLAGETEHRPILSGEDLPTKLDRLLAQRRDRYAIADLHVEISADESPSQTVDRIVTMIPTVLRQPTQAPE
jgi:shikimate kinase